MRDILPAIEPQSIVVRAGVPQPYGQLITAAHEAGIPVLFSANAFAKPDKLPSHIGVMPLHPSQRFRGFNLSAARQMPADLDAALDSAGFVAANRYGGYRWTVAQYYDLVQARNWSWHAAMDFCMEPQVAGSQLVRRIRLNATVQGYVECANEARRRGISMPMPVLQGWMPQDYQRCIDLLPIQEWPSLVGLGSVCRRNLGGPDGIAKIVEAIDKVLPPHVKLHLFGVKGGAIKSFGAHPRLASIDSMAWDFAVRCEHRTGRTQAIRAQAMTSWQAAQSAVQPQTWNPAETGDLFASLDLTSPSEISTEQTINSIVADWFAENLADHGYVDVSRMARDQAALIALKVHHHGIESLEDSSDMVEAAVHEALCARMESSNEAPAMRERPAA